jgi:hypothetical protein
MSVLRNDAELRGAYDALIDLYRGIAALRAELGDTSAFAVVADGPLHEIDRLTAEIEEYTGVTAAERVTARLWLRLVGDRARWRETSASVMTAFLDGLRKGVQAIAALNLTGPLSGRPIADLQRACDFELVVFERGSFRIGMALPEPPQHELFPEHESGEVKLANEVALALRDYLVVANWAASQDDADTLAALIPDVQRRRVALRAVKSVIPRYAGGIDFVELSGTAVPGEKRIFLAYAASERVGVALEKTIAKTQERYVGSVREMDLDKRTFRLRDLEDSDIPEVLCHLPDDLGPITATYLGKRAKVVGTRVTGTSALEVVDVDPLENIRPARIRRGA